MNEPHHYPLILDVDTGEDDALAILLAVKKQLSLPYIFTSYGNTTLENATRNSSRLLSLVQNSTTQLLPFSRDPLNPHPLEDVVAATADFVGQDGICQTPLPPATHDNIIHTSDPLTTAANLLRHTPPYDYIITGPCTNLARLCQQFGTDINRYINSITIMGGALYTAGNSGPPNDQGQPCAEFNFYNDPLAVNIVLNTAGQAGIPIRLVSWDITATVTIPYADIARFQAADPAGAFVIQLMRNFFVHYGLSHERLFELNDPLTILAYLGLGNYRSVNIAISTAKERYGQSYPTPAGIPISYWQPTAAECAQGIADILQTLHISQ
jgi:inosine-uridine nucleoside N-ribohydrolase